MFPNDPPKSNLNNEQQARREALQRANEELATYDSEGRRQRVDITGLITVATWILDGKDPWPRVVVDPLTTISGERVLETDPTEAPSE